MSRGLFEFHHHPDGLIYIKNNNNLYCVKLEEFKQYDKTDYSLPEGYVERLYTPNTRHFLIDLDGKSFPQPLDWEEGNILINNTLLFISNKQTRELNKVIEEANKPENILANQKRIRFEELKQKRKDGIKLTNDEIEEVLDYLMGI